MKKVVNVGVVGVIIWVILILSLQGVKVGPVVELHFPRMSGTVNLEEKSYVMVLEEGWTLEYATGSFKLYAKEEWGEISMTFGKKQVLCAMVVFGLSFVGLVTILRKLFFKPRTVVIKGPKKVEKVVKAPIIGARPTVR